MTAVEDVCGLYGVPSLRMQSRTFTVPGVGGKDRPFFVGEWRDAQGIKHRKGMADLLLMPRVEVKVEVDVKGGTKVNIPLNFTAQLWVECKSGSGVMTADQLAFRDWVLSIGMAHICVTDSCETLMAWLQEKNVRKP